LLAVAFAPAVVLGVSEDDDSSGDESGDGSGDDPVSTVTTTAVTPTTKHVVAVRFNGDLASLSSSDQVQMMADVLAAVVSRSSAVTAEDVEYTDLTPGSIIASVVFAPGTATEVVAQELATSVTATPVSVVLSGVTLTSQAASAYALVDGSTSTPAAELEDTDDNGATRTALAVTLPIAAAVLLMATVAILRYRKHHTGTYAARPNKARSSKACISSAERRRSSLLGGDEESGAVDKVPATRALRAGRTYAWSTESDQPGATGGRLEIAYSAKGTNVESGTEHSTDV